MKPIYTPLILLIVLLAFSQKPTLFAQAPANHTFSIHIGTFVKAEVSDFDNIRPFGFVYAEKFRNNMLKIFLGEFPTEGIANQSLDQIKAKGYPDAFVLRRNLQQGEKVHILQLDSRELGQNIVWQNYMQAGPLYAVLDNRQVNVVTGVFENEAEANQRLSIVQQLGFPNASVGTINNIYLHEISAFEAGKELLVPDVALVVESPVVETPVVETPIIEEAPVEVVSETSTPSTSESVLETIEEVASAPVEEATPPAVEMIPDSYDEVLTSRSPIAETPPVMEVPPVVEIPEVVEVKPARIDQPYIRPKVKRTSAIELQKVLKVEGAYTGSLDGYYGRGTKGAYAKILAAHPYVNRYQTLAQKEEKWTSKGGIEKDDLFSDWESLQLLNTIANDLDRNPAVSKSMQKEYAAIRAELYTSTIPLSTPEQKAIIEWNTSLWKGLDTWADKDPIHKKMTTPLKITYYQSMVLLEDYFMDKKFKPLEAKGLALSVLQTLVAPYLESYRM